jgi:hypothetical protein
MRDIPKLPEGCPWSDWAPPNIKWCEENLCAWITAPANTWSNLAYVLAAILLWHWARADGARARGSRNLNPEALKYFAPAALLVGMTSFLFHASYTFFFQFFDYVGMYVFFFLLITFNLRRGKLLSAKKHLPVYVALVLAMSALIPLFQWADLRIQLKVPALIAVIAGTELDLRFRKKLHAEYRWYGASLLSLAVAFGFTAADLTGAWCEPSNHWIQPHALWHVFSALSLLLSYRFYRQFFLEKKE